MKNLQTTTVLLLVFILTSCSSTFWNAMGTGFGNLSGGMYGGMYSGASMYGGVPYGLQPDVAADAAAKNIMNNITTNMWNDVNEGQRVVENMTKDVWKDGVPVTPVQTSSNSSTNSSSSNSQSSSSGSGHRCNLCNGTGRKVRESWVGDKTSTKWCNECNKSVGMGHSHTKCDLCGGDGWCD